MKTIRVVIPGTESTWCILKTGEPCEFQPLPEADRIQTIIGELDILAVTSGREVYCRREDLEETPCTPATTREFKVPKRADDGIKCGITGVVMSCFGNPRYGCTDCIYHYLATL